MTKRGFTLLEVLIVVIIIGILAAIALPQYTSTLEKAKSAEALTGLGSLRSSMDRYWYDQMATSAYTQLSGAAGVDSLDVEVDVTTWTYTIDDAGDTDGRDYVIQATKGDFWIDIDEDGNTAKSTNLGGDGTGLSTGS
ncbi:MAG: prepilin-type N-terminal cleavage/methylation domain-containing protein [Candidatus Gorgyraea atricola]|nr:prepilin-type N-terminal cleavage/methylation domain-containing protein [Candidatus Gorgyraea atricola]